MSILQKLPYNIYSRLVCYSNEKFYLLNKRDLANNYNKIKIEIKEIEAYKIILE